MNFSEMPVEIWADLLEEQGEDTTELREWIAGGLQVSDGVFYSVDGYGDGYSHDYSNYHGYGVIRTHSFGFGYKFRYGFTSTIGGYGHGGGYDDSTE